MRFPNEKGNKTRRRLLIAGVLTTGMTFCSGLTATFAWLSLTPFASTPDLLFGTDPEASAILTMGYVDSEGKYQFPEDIVYDDAGLESVFPSYDHSKGLDPVTGMNASFDPNDPKALPKLTGSYRGGDDIATFHEAEGGYHQFEFAFVCNHDCWLYLSPQSKITPNTEANKQTALDKEKDAAKLDEAVNALRVSFASSDGYYIACDKADEHEVNYGGLLDVLPYDGYYDHRDGKEIVYGQYEGQVNYEGVGDGTKSEISDFLNAGHASGVQKADLSGVTFVKEDARPFADFTLEDGVGQTSSIPLLELEANTPKRLVVSVYLEGWDQYCTNDIGLASMSLDLVFTGLVH